MSADEVWLDAAFAGCQSWLAGFRQTHGGDGPPPWDYVLMDRVGRDAVALMVQGVPRVDLCRLLWAAGRDGQPLNVEVPS